jgi:hypothetical protein
MNYISSLFFFYITFSYSFLNFVACTLLASMAWMNCRSISIRYSISLCLTPSTSMIFFFYISSLTDLSVSYAFTLYSLALTFLTSNSIYLYANYSLLLILT